MNITPPSPADEPSDTNSKEAAAFVAYPRQGIVVSDPPGTAEQLLALRFGFVWMAWVMPFSIAAMFLAFGLPNPERALAPSPLITSSTVAALAVIGCWKLAVGFGSARYSAIFYAVLGAILIGGTSVFCVGIFVIAGLLQKAINVIHEYGVPKRRMGTFSGSDVRAVALQLREPKPAIVGNASV